MNVRKVVFLVDMNAFFISCEMARNPKLLNKPAAVAGDPQKRTGIILTANYEARKFGVKTAMVVHRALDLCPNILLVPPDHNYYQQKSSEVMKLLSNYSPLIQKNSIDEAWLDMTGTESLFGPPREAAKKIMKDIEENLGLWCSIGISENKFLSKMASDMKKPQGITELWVKDVKNKLWPLPIESMYGIGEKTASKLITLGVQHIGHLAKLDPNYLYTILGKSGIRLHNQANGIDPSPVSVIQSKDTKSIGRSITFPEDLNDMNQLKYVLMELSEDIGMSARKHHKKGTVVQITLKFSNFHTITRQTTIQPTCFTKDIFHAAYHLLIKNVSPSKKIRLLGISLSGFVKEELSEQLSLFSTIKDSKHEKIDEVMDKIRNKYGADKIARASLIKNRK